VSNAWISGSGGHEEGGQSEVTFLTLQVEQMAPSTKTVPSYGWWSNDPRVSAVITPGLVEQETKKRPWQSTTQANTI
jgi:hypothetical protein